jgi:hypothetical protein
MPAVKSRCITVDLPSLSLKNRRNFTFPEAPDGAQPTCLGSFFRSLGRGKVSRLHIERLPMSAVITPRNVIDLVVSRNVRKSNFRLYDSPLQKWLFWLATQSWALGAILGLASLVWESQVLVWIAVALLLSAMLFAISYQIAVIHPDLLKLRDLEGEATNPLTDKFNDDLNLIEELARDYPQHHLEFAHASLTQRAEQLRIRIALIVGALDKVGIIPLAASAYLAILKLRKDGLLTFSGAEMWIVVSVIAVYLIAMRLNNTAQWMDRTALVFKQAMEIKRLAKPKDSRRFAK